MSHEQDVGLFDLDIGSFPVKGKSFVVIVNGDGQHAFGWSLSDHVLVKIRHDFARRWNLVEQMFRVATTTLFLIENIVAEVDTLATDIDIAWSLNERPNVFVAFTTE